MKILNAAEIRAWDQYTIEHEPISSIDLMERAATACVDWLLERYPDSTPFIVFCGKGNNGGDGLAIARMLLEKGFPVTVHILEFGHIGTEDFQHNLNRLHKLSSSPVFFIQSKEHFKPIVRGQVVIDALYGSGLNRPLDGVTAELVEHINASGEEIISIDIPSGLFVEQSSVGNPIVRATHTLSFQCYKPAFLLPENAPWIGDIHILDIGLHRGYCEQLLDQPELLDDSIIYSIYQPRKRFSHKGNFGHALLVAGSYGKTGACILAARACLRSGVGLLTVHVPQSAYTILQSTVAEAMVTTDFNSSFITKIETDLSIYAAIGIGPGLGTASETKEMLRDLLTRFNKPMVLDADALNILASDKSLLPLIPPGSILTPHPKEFERLFGSTVNDVERIRLCKEKADELNVVIVLKGHHSFIAIPGKKPYFNGTGNAGMATAGSGDVLTGILTGILSQGYSPADTAMLGVYLHGLAGDFAAKNISMEAMVAGDIIGYIGEAYLHIQQ